MVDLFCGLGGWASGGLAEGWDVIGFDIERHEYGEHRYPAQLVLQDVLTLHGSQFRDADLIVASPPCQEYSYMAMPWSLAKAKAVAIRADTSGQMLADLNRLFDACFRIQAQASLAAGRHIPMVVENVRGAQRWVGQARGHFGSYYLWGDVPGSAEQPDMFGELPTIVPWRGASVRKLSPHLHLGGGNSFLTHGREAARHDPRHAERRMAERGFKSAGMNWSDREKRGQDFTRIAGNQAIKNGGGSWFAIAHNTKSGHGQNPDGRKVPGGGADGWFGNNDHPLRQHTKGHPARKAASAMIAKIPLPLSRHIAAVYRPRPQP
jgi:hypothetical protein